MIVQIGTERIIADKTITISYKDKGIVSISGEESKYIYINPETVNYVHIEK